jgi:hypothetical protein
MALVEVGVDVDETRQDQPAVEIDLRQVAVDREGPGRKVEAMRPSSIVRSIRLRPSVSAASPPAAISVSGARALQRR